MGETLRRLTGKCLCVLVKEKASDFFQLYNCEWRALGTEKIVHGLRCCVEDHWLDNDFAVIKIDMKNAINLISREALFLECSNFFPELLPWAMWCYNSQPFLFHPLGILTSESGVQQGDPLGLLFFALVLHRIVSSIDADDDCLNLLYQAWYFDDGILAGSKSSLLQALTIIENMGPSLGIFINLSKCEVFCGSDTTMFPDSMEASTLLTSISLVLL